MTMANRALHLRPQTNPNLECPGSPDHQSDLTESVESVEGDENFINLLQYRDAYHMLNLSPHESSHPIPPETIQREYDSAKEQVLAALDQCEASDKQANGRNMFFVSQQNYLDLKLKALDQAYEELMPAEAMDENSRIQDGGRDALEEEMPSKKRLEKEVPSISTNAAVRSVRMNDRNQIVSPQHHRRVPSEDELDTIDIYFRPSPNPSRLSDIRRPTSTQPSDVSSCTWDGSSIFSMASKTKQNTEEASVGGLSDLLGPVYDHSPGLSETKAQRGATQISKRSKDTRNQHFLRPPSGINSKRPTAQISPKSVIDFPAPIHNNNHYDNTSVGRGKMTKGPRQVVVHNSEATEAARMGILRALSEDNSECLPLYPEDNSLNINNETNEKKTRGRSDRMPKASVTNARPVQHGQSIASASCNGPSSPSSTSSRSQRSKIANEHIMPSPHTNTYDSLLQAGECSYSAILQSSLEFADELCMALNDCWKVDPTAASAAFDASSSELDKTYLREDESTHFTQSTHDDSLTLNTRSVITDEDQSTAINTLSSFGRRADSSTLVKNRKMSPRPSTADLSDPSPRMLV